MGDLLVEAGVATRSMVQAGLDEQRLRGGRLGCNLMHGGRVTPAALYLFLKDRPEILAPEIAATLRHGPAVDLVPARLAHHYGMLPLRAVDGVLDLGISAVDTPRLLPAVEELTGLRVEPLICPPAQIRGALARFYPCEVDPGVIYRPYGNNTFILAARERSIRPRPPESLPDEAPSAEWLRAIAVEGFLRRARQVQIEPRSDAMRVGFRTALDSDSSLSLPAGAYPGVAALIEGLSRIASRGRILPCDGRMTMVADRRRVIVSVLALPAFEGRSYTLDLREERVAETGREELARDLPDLDRAVQILAQRGRGLLLVAGPGPSEAAVGVASVLALLGDRLPRRIALSADHAAPGLRVIAPPDDDEPIPLEALLRHARAENPDLLALPESRGPVDIGTARALAVERVVILPFRAADGCDAAEQMSRRGAGARGAADPVGILGVRLMETLCRSCRVPYDLMELLLPAPRHRPVAPGTFYSSPGCPACRASGVVDLQPVFEFLPAGDLVKPGVSAAVLRKERSRRGAATLFRSALDKASAGTVDVREPLRLLLHDQD